MNHLMYLLIIIIFVIPSCSNNKDIYNNTESPKYLGYYKIEDDSLIIPKFEIEVKLNEKTEDKILADKETISSHSNLNDVLNSVKCLISLKSILNFEPT